ncbi:hypothetical protein UU9_12333 [Rhodanobacter fulvus Jip2]|uniref:Bacteriophage protein n=1 Tax=Rhodanobacter fulvus Jip2 TaxID=1163408 RepID=I4VMU5_9GAMM|nr:DUF2184 domain-containing protein [Rhodanobacter fulvus]EIL88536.1 hypothetical protein UU9_12333 [Rhodanobacter fulvus Jip2]
MKQLILPRSVRAFTADHAADPSQMQGLTLDAATIDSAGAFLMGELERFDQRLYEPLVQFTWSRDIDIRSDVTLADEVSSFARINYGANPGTSSGSKKSFISTVADALPTVSVDLQKQFMPLTPWGMSLQWSVFELAASQKVGRPIDLQKANAMNLKWNMDLDEQTYIGDTQLGVSGLFNNPNVSTSNAPNGAASSPLWANKTPTEILADVNAVLNAAWAASGYKYVPTEIRLPPANFSYINAQLISTAGSRSILNYLAENSLSNAQNGVPLRILPVKWLTGAGASGTNRMVAYTKREDLVRLPVVPLQRTMLQVKGIFQTTDYYGKLGAVEFPYTETIAYMDGI